MGIAPASLQLFCCAKSLGVDFSDTITIGRQVMFVRSDETARILGTTGVEVDRIAEGAFAEPLFAALGAKQVSSVDASDYEGATFIHDFNEPLPSELRNRSCMTAAPSSMSSTSCKLSWTVWKWCASAVTSSR
jgi:hypothetical protein